MKLWSEYDRFDLEQDILKCSQIEEYLEEFLRQFLDHPEPMTEDEVHNYINGIIFVAKLHHGRLWEGFEKMIENRHFVQLEKYMPDNELKITVNKKGKKK